MGAILIPFLMSMLLGRSIDLTKYTIGGNVYDDQYYEEYKLNEHVTTYTVLQDNSFPYSFAGLPVDIVFRVKSGFLSTSSGSMGLDSLLKQSSWKQRSAVIAVTSTFQTVIRTLKKDAQPLPNFKTKIEDSQTHYANSIIYGGWSFILYRFKCEIPGDVEIVRKTLTSSLGYHGDLGPQTIELWKKARDAINKNPEIRGKVTVHVNTYSTFPFQPNFTSPDGLLNAVSQIPNLIGPVGKPIAMQLLPLHDLDAKYPLVEENHDSDIELEKLVEMYDDVKNTKNSIILWVSKPDSEFTDEQEDNIGYLLHHLTACIKHFHAVASEASVYKTMDRNLLNSSVVLYKSKLQPYANTYDRIFRRLKEDFGEECEDSFYHEIKGLLKVDDRERIDVGKVEGGVEECKVACLAEPKCRSIGYVEKRFVVKVTDTKPTINTLILEEKICYIYFRSSSTADVVAQTAGSLTRIYDRKC